MPVVTSIFLLLSLVLAALIGPQMRAWSWGPAMLALGFAAICSIPVLWRKECRLPSIGTTVFGILLIAWFSWRAWNSPVAEFAHADMLLLASAVAAFISIRAIQRSAAAERVLMWGIAGLLLASVLVVWKQSVDAEFVPLFRNRLTSKPAAFAGHYNEGANFLIATSLLLFASALFGKHATWTRILWLLIAASGMAAVYFTRSRGGVFGLTVGIAATYVLALLTGIKSKAKWVRPALITVPFIVIGIVCFLIWGLDSTQRSRSGGKYGIEQLVDDPSRLSIYSMTYACIANHPLAGGGSRSFSWEAFEAWQAQEHGLATHLPDLTHNELLQTATDYGLIGLALILALLGIFTTSACIRCAFENSVRSAVAADAWRIGGVAAMAGMLIQSSFSFVFHLLPGVLLLGICLGRAGTTAISEHLKKSHAVTATLLSLLTMACVVLLISWGWKGALVTRHLWPLYFKGTPNPVTEERIDAFTKAIEIWPNANSYLNRARLLQNASNEEGDRNISRHLQEAALGDYLSAAKLHRMDPVPAINAAIILSRLGNDAEAERWYDTSIKLQGNMEPAFQSHYHYADHLRRKGIREFEAGDPLASLRTIETAVEIFEKGVSTMAWLRREHSLLRVSLHESLGAAREANKDMEGAMAAYEFAGKLAQGQKANYRAAVLLGRTAVETWKERRPAEALWYFEAAMRRMGDSNGQLPENVTPEDRAKLITYINQTITFLKGAGIQPKEPSRK